jgi:hypothetical protein
MTSSGRSTSTRQQSNSQQITSSQISPNLKNATKSIQQAAANSIQQAARSSLHVKAAQIISFIITIRDIIILQQ